MKLNLIAAGALALTLAGMGSAQTPAAGSPAAHYTNSQVKQMMREAHTPEQYSTLAAYYTSRRQEYLQKGAEEKVEWERRSQNVTSVAAKYPRPVDSARNLYEYYMQEAAEAGALAERCNRMLATTNNPGVRQ